ncbi:hypothetical protein MPSYJ_39110 [Mycolicibacterium psychrotolerans]|uniref:Uncharacterized protein n=1 Tax=Mycolicibacterium psychrotolerans TaxID=216929 RepID=A0A7I7MF83_9MYCO|nr:hypothetical protein MPSYJ_39110 [Mycolicibacterium psychrotolerans]
MAQDEFDHPPLVAVGVPVVLEHVRTDGEVVHRAEPPVGEIPIQALVELRLAVADAAVPAEAHQVR